jgi:hypothetical protein
MAALGRRTHRLDGVGTDNPVMPADLVTEFRHAVLAGLSDVPRIPGP